MSKPYVPNVLSYQWNTTKTKNPTNPSDYTLAENATEQH